MRQTNTKTAGLTGRNAQALRLIIRLLTAYLCMAALHCNANTYLLVNSGSAEIYNRLARNLSKTLKQIDPSNTLTTSTLSNINSHIDMLTSGRYDVIISAGIEASIAISRADVRGKVVMAMLPKQSYQKLSARGEIHCEVENCRVILLDQPLDRQLRLLKLALPNTKHVAVIGSKNSSELISQLSKAAAKFGFIINGIIVSGEESLLAALNQGLTNADVLMAIPDPVVYNRNTARAILLTTFNQRIPLFAYSRSFVLAGATLGIYSTPEEIARHVADLLADPASTKKLPQILHPKYFSVDVNQRAAEALDINIPDTDLMLQRLESYEKE